ncbi:hypothetical protein CONCODRAFT_13273 [Conidiobolus coronatus NRRL 28638]|uniref:F-box domain-containing protein n=1 Tax=Conidiobolus coronatus (strain ATCC 28846 / CBS 209.66 / NRRL 28638) TaxID=796925 RepID=A0A137NR70_CONC2|nr:hypothetical protein CONCODRAFT_13273 [Conidiobolus coronatus NRRL 28638]|eukprot:KXN65222.1 hypothetical protein CONCODRAFT_13273 [Conidiobolus coronatus NRRL 28638]
MNNNEFNKVNWINIFILNNFQKFFNLKELQDLSKISKLTRLKLKSSIFKYIRLVNKSKYLNGTFVKSFNSKSFDEISRVAYMDGDEVQKSVRIQKSLNDINSELQDIKHLANNLHMYDVMRSGYYICPILNNFANLSSLMIRSSTIPYSIFQKLGEYFPTLKTIELYNIVLSKSTTDSPNPNEIIFPLNLTNLMIGCVEVTDMSILSDPYKMVLNDFNPYARSNFSLPNISLPSLKELRFVKCAGWNNGLEEFLEKNPGLEQLTIDTFNPNMSKRFTSLKSLSLELVNMYENLQNLIVNHNIKTLKVNIEDDYYYEKFEKVCLMCPSIEFLHFNVCNIDTYQKAYSNYLIPILRKLPNLKTLELPIYAEDPIQIDVDDFPQIKKIIFVTDDVRNLQVYFDGNPSLQQIEFISASYDICEEDIWDKYGHCSGWRFKFYEKKVIGYIVY